MHAFIFRGDPGPAGGLSQVNQSHSAIENAIKDEKNAASQDQLCTYKDYFSVKKYIVFGALRF